jgi:hypothetical protein
MELPDFVKAKINVPLYRTMSRKYSFHFSSQSILITELDFRERHSTELDAVLAPIRRFVRQISGVLVALQKLDGNRSHGFPVLHKTPFLLRFSHFNLF